MKTGRKYTLRNVKLNTTNLMEWPQFREKINFLPQSNKKKNAKQLDS